jgi:hypothetical protein
VADTIPLYAELGGDGGALLYSFEPPGLVARGASLDEAMGRALAGYAELLDMLRAARPGLGAAGGGPLRFEVVEEFRRRRAVADGNTVATFGPDLQPVSREEVTETLDLLAESRRRLLLLRPVIEGAADPERLMAFRSLPHRMTVAEQLRHIANAERWYLSRLKPDLPRLAACRSVWDRLERVREMALAFFRGLTAADLALVTRVEDETWTVRKALRRFVYHEIFHRDTVRRDLGAAGAQAGGLGLKRVESNPI